MTISDQLSLPNITMPPPIQTADEPPPDATDEQKATQLPEPTGYRLLCVVPDVNETFENSNIIKADTFMKNEEHATTVLFVLKVGPDAYKDTAKFPTGPWCKEGDFIVVRPNAGTRLEIHGREFRIINDDSVECTVEDPRGIRRK